MHTSLILSWSASSYPRKKHLLADFRIVNLLSNFSCRDPLFFLCFPIASDQKVVTQVEQVE
jgi:hypothetical protein